MTVLKMAVIGVGSLGQHHARILSEMDGVRLAGVVDPRESQGRQIADQFGSVWHPRAEDLPDDIDAVVIATPTVHHVAAAERFLKAGTAALIEKPLAATVQDARRLHELAQKSGAVLQVGHVERFNPAFEKALQQCGTVRYLRCQRVSPYSFRSTEIGAVHDLMIHDIDLALALTGTMPESVESFGAVLIGPYEDSVVARLRMPGRTIVDLTASRVAPQAERTLQIWGSTGCISVDLQARTVTSWTASAAVAAHPGLIASIAAASPNPLALKDRVFGEWIEKGVEQASERDALTAELREFTDAVRGRTVPRVSGREAVRAMEVADQVLQALHCWSWQDEHDSRVRAA